MNQQHIQGNIQNMHGMTQFGGNVSCTTASTFGGAKLSSGKLSKSRKGTNKRKTSISNYSKGANPNFVNAQPQMHPQQFVNFDQMQPDE